MDIAPLDRETVEKIVEHMRKQIAGQMGVTLQEDHNGAWGRAGARYLTVRFGNPDDKSDLVEVHMEIKSIRSSAADDEEHAYQTADK